MSNYCVFHINKYKGDLSRIGAHIDRLYIPHNANKEKSGFNEDIILDEKNDLKVRLKDILGTKIEPTKSAFTEKYDLENSDLPLNEAVAKRIKEGHTIIDPRTGKIETIRRDAVTAIGIILTGTHERMLEIQADEKLFTSWKRKNFDFLIKKFGKKNIVRFVLHLDEKTAHIHAIVVPINDKGRLSASSFLDCTLKNFQDEYGAAMEPFGLSRGIPKELTHSLHKTTSDYYREQRADEIEIKKLVSDIKTINLDPEKIKGKIVETILKKNIALKEQTYKTKRLEVTNYNLMDNYKSLAYQKTLEEESKRIYDLVKKIPLGPFLIDRLGYKENKLKTTKSDFSLTSPSGEKIIVPTEPKSTTGHYVYSYPQSHSDRKGGTIIDILQKENWNWKEISELAKEKFGNSLPSQNSPISQPIRKEVLREADPGEQAKQAQTYIDSINSTDISPFLNIRSINKGTYQELSGIKVSQEKAIFSLYKDFDASGDYNLCSTITYSKKHNGDNSKYFQKDLPRGLSVLTDEKGISVAKNIVITESPIDALSYKQLSEENLQGWKQLKAGTHEEKMDINSDRTAFISTCGNLSFQIKKDIQMLLELANRNNQTVIIAMDNDLAGKKMTEEIIHIAQESECRYQVEIPTLGKDWNDVLVNKTQIPDQKQEKQLSGKQWEIFEDKPYETSLLTEIGINKNTYEEFRGIIKSDEKTILVALQENNHTAGTWSLNKNSEKELKESVSVSPPVLSILKGDLEQAKKVVIVTSPLDCLIHFQNQKMDSPRFKEKEDKVCYIYADTSFQDKLQYAIAEFKNKLENKEIILVNRKTNDPLDQKIEYFLQQEKLNYTKNNISSNTLTGGMNLLSTLLSMNKTNLAYEEEEEYREKKKILKIS